MTGTDYTACGRRSAEKRSKSRTELRTRHIISTFPRPNFAAASFSLARRQDGVLHHHDRGDEPGWRLPRYLTRCATNGELRGQCRALDLKPRERGTTGIGVVIDQRLRVRLVCQSAKNAVRGGGVE